MRTPSNILVVNLALLDFIMMSTMPVFVINSLNEGPIWGKLGCDVYAVLGSYSGIGGAMSNAAIAYDRYRLESTTFSFSISAIIHFHLTELLQDLLMENSMVGKRG